MAPQLLAALQVEGSNPPVLGKNHGVRSDGGGAGAGTLHGPVGLQVRDLELAPRVCEVRLFVAIRHAARGDYFLAGAAGRDLVAEYVRPAVNRQKPGGRMTQRERELAILLADGYSTKEAAAVLNISAKTAETHRASIMRKLGARNVADVVKYCIRNHLVEL